MNRELGESTIMSLVRGARVGPLSPIIASAVVIVLVAATAYVAILVRRSIQGGIQDSLQTVLAANVSALELWLDDQCDRARELSSDPRFSRFAVEVFKQYENERNSESDSYLSSRSRLLLQRDLLGWAILDPSGRVLRSSIPGTERLDVPLTNEVIGNLVSGEAAIVLPFRWQLDARIDPATNEAANVSHPVNDSFPPAVMCAVSPIRSDLQLLGSVAILIDPARQFSDILTVAGIGSSGETYAFDKEARLISTSRFEPDLIACGMLKPNQSSLLNVHVRNPGHDTRKKNVGQSLPLSWPMTLMADAATRGGTGVNVAGYQDYRGVSVVGAWTWLADHQLGITTELEVEEAYAPLRILRNAFFTLVAAVLLTGVTLIAVSWLTRPKKTAASRLKNLNRRLGQYELHQQIGRGGMGSVYLGTHGLLNRKVAIKVLGNAEATERSLARFQREVQLSARLMHPNTIEIYDFGRTDDGTFFYVMEFVDGVSLEQLVDHYGRQPGERVIYLMMQLCSSIAEAHDAGMVHRDIKPANVLLTSRSGIHDLVKVLDFGLAKQLDHDSLQITRTDSLTGTPLFMSPESIRDASSSDRLSDIYSIGAVGYTLLCGQPPFDGPTSADVCALKLHGEPEWPEEKISQTLAYDLQSVLMRCLRRDPSLRPESVHALATELSKCEVTDHWSQQDAALWWREVFDGPYVKDLDFSDEDSKPADGTKGDTAVLARKDSDPRKTVGGEARSANQSV
ncbi:MAG: serine/threonine protein kinase [Planctomycetota bacterium]